MRTAGTDPGSRGGLLRYDEAAAFELRGEPAPSEESERLTGREPGRVGDEAVFHGLARERGRTGLLGRNTRLVERRRHPSLGIGRRAGGGGEGRRGEALTAGYDPKDRQRPRHDLSKERTRDLGRVVLPLRLFEDDDADEPRLLRRREPDEVGDVPTLLIASDP